MAQYYIYGRRILAKGISQKRFFSRGSVASSAESLPAVVKTLIHCEHPCSIKEYHHVRPNTSFPKGSFLGEKVAPGASAKNAGLNSE